MGWKTYLRIDVDLVGSKNPDMMCEVTSRAEGKYRAVATENDEATGLVGRRAQRAVKKLRALPSELVPTGTADDASDASIRSAELAVGFWRLDLDVMRLRVRTGPEDTSRTRHPVHSKSVALPNVANLRTFWFYDGVHPSLIAITHSPFQSHFVHLLVPKANAFSLSEAYRSPRSVL